jgi:hypothetical protein
MRAGPNPLHPRGANGSKRSATIAGRTSATVSPAMIKITSGISFVSVSTSLRRPHCYALGVAKIRDEVAQVIHERGWKDGQNDRFAQEERPAHDEARKAAERMPHVGIGPANFGIDQRALRKADDDQRSHTTGTDPGDELGRTQVPRRHRSDDIDVRSDLGAKDEEREIERVQIATEPRWRLTRDERDRGPAGPGLTTLGAAGLHRYVYVIYHE